MEGMVVGVLWLLVVVEATKENNQKHWNLLHTQCNLIDSFHHYYGGCDVERKLPEIYRILLTLTKPHAAIQTPRYIKLDGVGPIDNRPSTN